MRHLSFVIIIMVFKCVSVTAEPTELESLRTRMDMLDLRLTFNILKIRKDSETERKMRMELQSTVQQLQEQKFTNRTKSLDETDILRAELMAQQSIMEQLQKDVHLANYQIQIAKHENTRLQNEVNNLRHITIVLNKAFSNEKPDRKQMEHEFQDFKSKHEELRLELTKMSDQVNELRLFKSSTEISLSRLQSNLHQIETKQNAFNSSSSTAKMSMGAYINGVSNDICPLYPSYVDVCKGHVVNKSICCLKEVLQSIQETIRVNGRKQSEFELKQNMFSKEMQNKKKIENEVQVLKSKHEDLQLEIRKASDHQVNELTKFKLYTEESITKVKSDLRQIETKQNYFDSSTSTTKRLINAYIDGVSKEICPLYPSFFDVCQGYVVNKSICCLRGALQYMQEILKVNGPKQSEF